MMDAILPETLFCAKNLDEEQNHFRQNSPFSTCNLRNELHRKETNMIDLDVKA